MRANKKIYSPKNPLRSKWVRQWVSITLEDWERIEEFGQIFDPPLTAYQVLRFLLISGFADWLKSWMELKAPKDGRKIRVEEAQIFPTLLHTRSPRERRKK